MLVCVLNNNNNSAMNEIRFSVKRKETITVKNSVRGNLVKQ